MLSDAKAPTVLPSLDVVRDPRHVFPIRLFHRIERQKVAVRILLAVLGSGQWALLKRQACTQPSSPPIAPCTLALAPCGPTAHISCIPRGI